MEDTVWLQEQEFNRTEWNNVSTEKNDPNLDGKGILQTQHKENNKERHRNQ